MQNIGRWISGVAVVLGLAASPVAAQVLHVNDRWEDCAIVIAPELDQGAWHQFVDEVALVSYFRPLASARPAGPGRFEITLLSMSTRIDDADDAWNDTFSHPDSTHWLFEGNALRIPAAMVRVGVTDRLDVGAYFTQNPESNYGLYGGQVQYSLLNDLARKVAVAGRVSAVRLFGPEDLSVTLYGVDLLASKDVGAFSPYVGLSGYLSRGQEHTAVVDLEAENVFGVHATTGIVAAISVLRLGAELGLGRVTSYSFKIGVAP